MHWAQMMLECCMFLRLTVSGGSAGGDVFTPYEHTPLSASMTVCVSTWVERDILFIVSLFTVCSRVCHLWLLLFEAPVCPQRRWPSGNYFFFTAFEEMSSEQGKTSRRVCRSVVCVCVCVIWHIVPSHTQYTISNLIHQLRITEIAWVWRWRFFCHTADCRMIVSGTATDWTAWCSSNSHSLLCKYDGDIIAVG